MNLGILISHVVSQLEQDIENRAPLTAFQFRILPVVLGRVERGRIRKNWSWLRKHEETLNKKASGRVCSMRVYSVCMINTQKSEMLLQIGKTICHFQVGMTLELIDLNCNKEILTLVVGKNLWVGDRRRAQWDRAGASAWAPLILQGENWTTPTRVISCHWHLEPANKPWPACPDVV